MTVGGVEADGEGRSSEWTRVAALAGIVIAALCWIKVVLGLDGPLSTDSSLPYRILVLVLVPLGLGIWLKGLSELELRWGQSLSKAGVGIAWLGIIYVALAGLEQYFLDLVGPSIPWAGSGYLLILLGLLFVGIPVLFAKRIPIWSRALPLLLGFPIPLLMLAKSPEESSLFWSSFNLLIGMGFLVLSGVLFLSTEIGKPPPTSPT